MENIETYANEKIKERYLQSVDKEIYDFVRAVTHGNDVKPITVGYLSDNQRRSIIEVLPNSNFDFASRCMLDADAVRHIINRHGENGKADQKMSDILDIARMSYVFANFDEVSFDDKYSKKYKNKDGSCSPHIILKKRINGTYYIIEAVSDSKTNKSHIVSAYIG